MQNSLMKQTKQFCVCIYNKEPETLACVVCVVWLCGFTPTRDLSHQERTRRRGEAFDMTGQRNRKHRRCRRAII